MAKHSVVEQFLVDVGFCSSLEQAKELWRDYYRDWQLEKVREDHRPYGATETRIADELSARKGGE